MDYVNQPKNAWPKWTDSGRMSQDLADRGLGAMQAVHDTLVALAPKETP